MLILKDMDFSRAKQLNFFWMSKIPTDNLSVRQNVSSSAICYGHLGRTRGHFLPNKFKSQDQLDTVANMLIRFSFFFPFQNSVYTKSKLGSRQTQYTENIITQVVAKTATPCLSFSTPSDPLFPVDLPLLQIIDPLHSVTLSDVHTCYNPTSETDTPNLLRPMADAKPC